MPMSPAPPLPPGMQGSAAPGPSGPPSMMQLAGMPQGSQGATQPNAGMSQISESVVRMSAEIDQALKLLAQSLPQLAPWVEQTTMQLKQQIGQALQAGAVPTSPVPNDSDRFPDGGSRL